MLKKIPILIISLVISSFSAPHPREQFPYKEAGLTERQAAAHLLNRFTFGPRPGQVDEVVKLGLEKWLEQQLDGKLAEKKVEALIADYDTQHLSNAEIANIYVRNGQAARMAMKEGFLKDSIDKEDKKEYREAVRAFMDSKGLKPEQELIRQTISQKIIRAIYSENQLHEVLTDFWFNHFNVSFTKNDCSLFIPVYERESIRPNVTADFEKLLVATAQSPAMLLYLDNFTSIGENATVMQRQKKPAGKPKRMRGLNENYAREVMELHTLGVDGGYTQSDVTQAARMLTGWTIYPMGKEAYGAAIKKQLDDVGEDKLRKRGFVHEGDFLFAANRHDDAEKTVLGKKFPAGGYQQGVDLLSMLAHHPSTAKFITKKIAVRFASDNPPQSLLDKMSATFTKENGNIRKVLLTMVEAPEFWQPDVLREKTKSPFELAVSAVRAVDGKVDAPQPLSNWITRMGQRVYYYQAPTGFPDKATYWINTGSLLNRMNFGLALSTGKIRGTSFDLLALNKHHEPESAVEALQAYAKILLPERDLEKTIQRLTPLLNDPDLPDKINKAAEQHPTIDQQPDSSMVSRHETKKPDYGLAQVIGIIIGSPEFQRR